MALPDERLQVFDELQVDLRGRAKRSLARNVDLETRFDGLGEGALDRSAALRGQL